MQAKELAQCNNCLRRFTGDRVKIHEAICQKSASLKRQSFDISEQRLKGTDIQNFLKTNPEAAEKYENSSKRSSTLSTNWRWKHNEFIKKVQQLKDEVLASKKSASSKQGEFSEFVQCPYCKMKFSQQSAQRHMILCAKMMGEK